MRCGVYVRVSTDGQRDNGYHYNSDKIKDNLKRILNELTRFMYDNSNEIITCSSTKRKEVKEIEKAIEKLRVQEKRLIFKFNFRCRNYQSQKRCH